MTYYRQAGSLLQTPQRLDPFQETCRYHVRTARNTCQRRNSNAPVRGLLRSLHSLWKYVHALLSSTVGLSLPTFKSLPMEGTAAILEY